MEELNQFLNSVEASARRILKQQNKKQQELIAKDRAALVRAGKHGNTTVASTNGSGSPTKSISREELTASYSPGGALIVQAPATPTSPLKSPSHRSEHEGEDTTAATYLPRIPQPGIGEASRTTASLPPYLPAIEGKRSAAQAQQSRDPAVEAARKANRDKRTADKIMSSPLYKSMAKSKSDSIPQGFGTPSPQSVQSIKKAIHEVDNVNLLLKKLGMRENASPTRRPDHAVEKRMCNACWASPNKVTGCEHHARVMPTNNNSNVLSGLSDEAQMLRQMELQGPTSWLSDDLYVKFRSEYDRERLWQAFCRLKEAEAERERLGDVGEVAVIPIVTRHPICDKYYTQIELENLKTQAETRRRNQTKAFIFDVNHVWLTNLDHFNGRLVNAQRRRQRKLARMKARHPESGDGDGGGLLELEPRDGEGDDELEDGPSGSDVAEQNALRDRRDEAAIRDGYCQIQSISTSRALQNAVFPDLDPSMSSFSLQRQTSTRTATTPTTTASDPGTPASRRRRRPHELPFKVAPLTLIVCGQWNAMDPVDSSSLTRVPGVAVVGKHRVLWWQYPHDDPDIEYTKTVAMFARSKTLSSTNAILVTLLLALDAPQLSPLWFAWHMGSKTPPPPFYEAPIPVLLPPQDISPCRTSLLSSKLQTRIDTLLPGTIMLLNAMPHDEDFVLGLDEPYGHRRFWTEFHERDEFRQWWLCTPGRGDPLPPNYDVDPQECSILVAQPNATGVGGRFTWHSVDIVRQHLNRPRLEKDYVYIIANHLTCGSNGALWFIVSMTHEIMRDVSAAKLSEYLAMLEERRRKQEYEEKLMEIEKKIELGRLQLEAKRQEQKRIEEELSAKAARASDCFNTDKINEAALLEWDDRLQNSTVTDEQVGWQRREITDDQSHVVFYYALNEALPPSHRFSWEKPIVWPAEDGDSNDGLTSRSDASSASSASTGSDDSNGDGDDRGLSEEEKKTREAISQMANALLADEQFLRVLKAKLGLDIDENDDKAKKKQRRRSTFADGDDDHDDDLTADQLDLRDHMIMLTEEQDRSKASLMATKMAKLQLPAKATKTTPTKPGEGWKRLKVSKLPRNFARSVYSTHTEGPRSAFINQPNHSTPVGMIDPREASPYEPPDFVPELRALLIPKANADLQEKKLQWAEYLATHPPESEVKSGAQAGVTGSPAKSVSATQAAKDAVFERDPAESDMTMEQLVAKAILCARNNNLQGLEDALDSGCEINARDNHGNSLFILVCQQGNKKIAKFLMRRHADMNLQNLNGNTALHYLIEYKHTELADYIKAKGAIDTIQNAAGLTCYEGLSLDQVEKL